MILQNAKHNLLTREITETEAWEVLDWFLGCFQRHGIDEVTLIYGYDWNVGEASWQDQPISVENVSKHIKAAEEQELGYLNEDDLYIRVADMVQVQFCHHSHLHLNYNQDDQPLITDLHDYFTETIGLRQ